MKRIKQTQNKVLSGARSGRCTASPSGVTSYTGFHNREQSASISQKRTREGRVTDDQRLDVARHTNLPTLRFRAHPLEFMNGLVEPVFHASSFATIGNATFSNEEVEVVA